MARDLEHVVVDPWDASAIARVPDPEPDPEPDEVEHWCLADAVRRVPYPAPLLATELDN
jgi:hypothetical protein